MHYGFLSLVDTSDSGVPLYLRINDDTPGGGDGSFSCRVRIWRSPLILPPAIPVACQPIVKNLTTLENQLKQLHIRLEAAAGAQKPPILDLIDSKNEEIVSAKARLNKCIIDNSVA